MKGTKTFYVVALGYEGQQIPAPKVLAEGYPNKFKTLEEARKDARGRAENLPRVSFFIFQAIEEYRAIPVLNQNVMSEPGATAEGERN